MLREAKEAQKLQRLKRLWFLKIFLRCTSSSSTATLLQEARALALLALKKLLIGHCTHLWVYDTYFRTSLTFFHDLNAQYERCELKAMEKLYRSSISGVTIVYFFNFGQN